MNTNEYHHFTLPLTVLGDLDTTTKFQQNQVAYDFIYMSAREYVCKEYKESLTLRMNPAEWWDHIRENVLKNNPFVSWMLDSEKLDFNIILSALSELYYHLKQVYISLEYLPIKDPNSAYKSYTISFSSDFPIQQFLDKFSIRRDQQYMEISLPDLGIVSIPLSPQVQAVMNNPSSVLNYYTVSRSPTGSISVVLGGVIRQIPQTFHLIPHEIGIYVDQSDYSKISFSDGNQFSYPMHIQRIITTIHDLQTKLMNNPPKDSRDYQALEKSLAGNQSKLLTSIFACWYSWIQTLFDADYRYIYYEDQPHHVDFNISLDSTRPVVIPGWDKFFNELQKRFGAQRNYQTKLIPLLKRTSTKTTCSHCEYDISYLDNDSTQTWVCPRCGTTLNTGTNAASNLLILGHKISSNG